MTPPHPLLSFMARALCRGWLQCGEAGGSRGAAAEKSFLLEQPAQFRVSRGNQREFS